MFVQIPDYPDYLINHFGEIISLKNGKWKQLSLKKNRGGYLQIKLCRNGNIKTKDVHRLVAVAFFGQSNLCVNHKDGNKLNNNIDNLEYVTLKENIQHAWRTGLNEKNREAVRQAQLGSASKNSKLSEQQAICLYSLKGKITQKQASELFGICQLHHKNLRQIWQRDL